MYFTYVQWVILWSFGIFFPFVCVNCGQINLATLERCDVLACVLENGRRGDDDGQAVRNDGIVGGVVVRVVAAGQAGNGVRQPVAKVDSGVSEPDACEEASIVNKIELCLFWKGYSL
jgi:hypothetical protein